MNQSKRKWKIFHDKIKKLRTDLFLQIDPNAAILYCVLELYSAGFAVSDIIKYFPFQEHREILSSNSSLAVSDFVLIQLINFQNAYGEESLNKLIQLSENYILLTLKFKLVANDNIPNSIRKIILDEHSQRAFIGLDYEKANLNIVH